MQPNLTTTFRAEIEAFLRSIPIQDRVQPGFSLSIKTAWQNLFGVIEEILLFGQVSWPENSLPTPDQWAVIRLSNLISLLEYPQLDPQDLPLALNNLRAIYESPQPLPGALLHAASSEKYVCFCEPFPLLAAFCKSEPQSILEKWFGDRAAILKFDANLHRLSQAVHQQSSQKNELILLNRGLIIGASSPETVWEKLAELELLASEKFLPFIAAPNGNESPRPPYHALPKIRAEICAQRGRPLVLHLDDSARMSAFINSPVGEQISREGLPIPEFSVYTGLPSKIAAEDAQTPTLACESQALTSLVLHPVLGSITAANSTDEARQASQIFHTFVEACSAANQAGEVQWKQLEELQVAEKWSLVCPPAPRPYSGEVALVTGSASGIGKAIAESLLKRGCAVVGLDVDPLIETTFDHSCYQGMICDVFDESGVCETMNHIARRFGGLDMLVLNAGLFPGGCSIEKLTLAEFTKVLNINFVANLVIMREAYPMLRSAPRYGRVVIVGSKNTRAPGPGAAAYSTSKAALTQLARVAALEWAGERIRVNVVHPDAVFDTALYTPEVLEARAAHYGMTVEQYKKRNLLKTEITSHDVAELACEMCGPLFRHMTGVQIQIDGGNERTI